MCVYFFAFFCHGSYRKMQIVFSCFNYIFFLFSERYLRNIRNTKDGVVIMRGSKWGNPYLTRLYGRKRAIEMFERHLLESGLLNQIEELRDCILICACAPEYDCHGDIILKYLYGSSKQNFAPS